MTYHGHVRNGVVVFDDALPLEEGTVVRIEPVQSPGHQPRPGSAEAILRHAGIWAGEAQEVDRLLQELRDTKQAELKAQQEQQDPTL